GLEALVGARQALIDGDPSPGAADGLAASDACAVLVGAGGLGGWARDEGALAQGIASSDRSFPLFTLLLPGAPEPFGAGLAVLASRPWVDLRAGLEDEEGRRDLIRAVRGELRFGAPLLSMGEDRSPYLGLAPFGEEDTELFFGREEETAEAIERL